MSESKPLFLEPVMVVQDRYQGTYSRGGWLAIANADALLDGSQRASWVLENGPSSDDLGACAFWADQPAWIAAGNTTEEAIAKLCVANEAPIA